MPFSLENIASLGRVNSSNTISEQAANLIAIKALGVGNLNKTPRSNFKDNYNKFSKLTENDINGQAANNKSHPKPTHFALDLTAASTALKRPFLESREQPEAKLAKPEEKYNSITSADLIAWQALTQLQRDMILLNDYADAKGFNRHTWSHLVSKQGLSIRGESRLKETRHSTLGDLIHWDNLSQNAKDNAGGSVKYAFDNNIHHDSWVQLATNTGLSKKGRLKLAIRHNPTTINILHWRDMPQAERDAAGGAEGYALYHGIHRQRWATFARADGLTERGKSVLKTTHIPTLNEISAWHDMTQQQRDEAGGARFYSLTNNIHCRQWDLLANGKGLTKKGLSRIARSRGATTADLEAWRDMMQSERVRVGVRGYALREGLNVNSWTHYVNVAGLKEGGWEKLARGNPPQKAHLIKWRNLPYSTRKSLGVEGFSRKEQINAGSFRSYANLGGLTETGEKKLKGANFSAWFAPIKQEPATSNAKGPVMLITYGANGNEIEIHNPTPSRIDELSQLDNSLPILRDPDDFTRSLTLSAEKVSSVHELGVTHWGTLGEIMETMPQKAAAALKQTLLQACRRQVANETGLEEEMARQMVSRSCIYADEMGELINLGTGVFNPQLSASVPQFTVLGPYAGVFRDFETLDPRANPQRQIGSARFHSHSWETRSSRRIVDGWQSGNVLRNMNTGKMGSAPAVADANVAMIRLGKNIPFYVTLKAVLPGEQYFVDYGPAYNPDFAIDSARKEERVAQNWVFQSEEAARQGISLEQVAFHHHLSPKYLGRAVLALSTQSPEAILQARESWLTQHGLPNGKAEKTTAVSTLYLHHQAEMESLGITTTRLAAHYAVNAETLEIKIGRLQKVQKGKGLSKEALRWLDENDAMSDAPAGIKREPPALP